MSENWNRGTRDLSKFNNMETEALKEILRLDAEAPEGTESDTELILYVMEVLADRRRNRGETGKTAIEAYETFQQFYLPEVEEAHMEADTEEKPKAAPLRLLRSLTAAAAVLAFVIFGAVTANADSFWEKLAQWTDTFFEYIIPGAERTQTEYVFETDNPGLQQVYDAVTELGVTEPIVPMWLPEGYEITDCTVETSPEKSYVRSRFLDGNCTAVFRVNISNSNIPGQYQKDGEQVKQIEIHGTTYNIMRNYENWMVAWSKENVECFITIDCQEETIYRILNSIYTGRDK